MAHHCSALSLAACCFMSSPCCIHCQGEIINDPAVKDRPLVMTTVGGCSWKPGCWGLADSSQALIEASRWFNGNLSWGKWEHENLYPAGFATLLNVCYKADPLHLKLSDSLIYNKCSFNEIRTLDLHIFLRSIWLIKYMGRACSLWNEKFHLKNIYIKKPSILHDIIE